MACKTREVLWIGVKVLIKVKKQLDKTGRGEEEESRRRGQAMQKLFQTAPEKKKKVVKKNLTKDAGVGRSEHTRRGTRRQLSRAAWVAARDAKKKRFRRAEEKK